MKTRRDVFQAIADPTRRAILVLLTVQALPAGVIAANFNFSQQTISKHIQILTECKLLKRESKGREIYYELDAVKMKIVTDWAEQFRELWDGRLNRMGAILKSQKNKGASN